MDQTPVVAEEIDAGREFALAFNDLAPVTAVFWLKEGEVSQKYLFLAFEFESKSEAYDKVFRLNSAMPSAYLEPMQIKVVAPDSPFGRAAQDLNRRFPAPLGTRLGGCLFGDAYIDYAYIYPAIEILQTGPRAVGRRTSVRQS